MKYTSEYLKELGIVIECIIEEATWVPKLKIKVRNKIYSTKLTRVHIEDIKWQTSYSEDNMEDKMTDIMIDEFLEKNPKYLRKIKLDKINESRG